MRGMSNCPCCDAEFQTGGCVIGYRCGCDRGPQCDLCSHCTEHHHKNCTEELRMGLIQFIAGLRERHGINIFEPGEVKTARSFFDAGFGSKARR